MAFENYHASFTQVGTDVAWYKAWVEADALGAALQRLTRLMLPVPSSTSQDSREDGVKCSHHPLCLCVSREGFERALLVPFPHPISDTLRPDRVTAVAGICDWQGRGLKSLSGKSVDVLEVKFVSQLSNAHRIQVLVYCALLAVETQCSCSALLYNARNGESEVCTITHAHSAMEFLLDIATFKYNGTRREKVLETGTSQPAPEAAQGALHSPPVPP
jgi:hypothetical protein